MNASTPSADARTDSPDDLDPSYGDVDRNGDLVTFGMRELARQDERLRAAICAPTDALRESQLEGVGRMLRRPWTVTP